MGIESDRMVFDYLSEVGDLAQQRHLPPGERSALVAGLRDEIDRRRTTHGEESAGAVRGILGDLGTPDEVVKRAAPWWSAEAPTADEPSAGPSAEAAAVPRPRGVWHGGADDAESPAPGFIGGIEAPELFRPPDPDPPEPEAPELDGPPASRRRLARLLRRRPPRTPDADPIPDAAPEPRVRGLAHPFLLLAALSLIAGAAFGWLLALALGWLVAYGSRRLTPGQIKTAVFVLPGVAAAGGAAWLWGRTQGRWGAPIAPDALGAALAETWPWTLRAAAVLSALYLLHHARRR
ncbi:hypothetical protein ACF1BN_36080 [Streptomyces sp. NPDC014861]|uniref:hypothetical protein n=1 Tax=Streptomyces sp. NPDC014861 TaxID=3364923 RepID=UPI0036F68F45